MINTIKEEALNLRDGVLCLDFTNTVGMHASEKPIEYLNTYQDLLNWSLEKKIFSEQESAKLREQAANQPEEAQAILERAIELREAIYRILLASIENKIAQPGDINLLNRWLSIGMSHLKLDATEKGFSWSWLEGESSLDAMLWWVALSAGGLLASENLARVGECADEHGCGWLFLDTSRNHSRRWCDMNDCGNRAKSRRHYEKVTESRAE